MTMPDFSIRIMSLQFEFTSRFPEVENESPLKGSAQFTLYGKADTDGETQVKTFAKTLDLAMHYLDGGTVLTSSGYYQFLVTDQAQLENIHQQVSDMVLSLVSE